MSTGTGIDSQLMLAEETTYGTPVTPARGFRFIDESLGLSIERIASAELRATSRVARSEDWAAGARSVTGDVNMELATKGHGIWFKHALGGVATSQPDAAGNPTVYKHTFTPGDLPTGLTVQVGRPARGGTVHPFTYHGCTVANWQLDCAISGLAKLKFGLLGEDEDTATALAVVSYATAIRRLSFVQGSLTIAGSAVKVKNATVSGTNTLAEDGYSLGSALREQPLEAGMRSLTGSVAGDFRDLAAYNRFVDGTEAELILLFQGGTISSTYKYETKVTANVRFDGETPKVTGAGVLQQNLPFTIVDNGTTSIKIEYQTTDTTP